MTNCKCHEMDKLSGQDLDDYKKKHLIRLADHEGWVILFQCKACKKYWEMKWEDANGFDDGVRILRRISMEEAGSYWPGIIDMIK